MIRIHKDYTRRPGKINFLESGQNGRARTMVTLIKSALREGVGHRARGDFYRGDFEEKSSVLYALFKLYNYKCAYCESVLKSSQSSLQVEHYRPKRANLPGKGIDFDGQQHHLGYYWLAYEWSNLLLSCSTCNGGKSAQFPIAGNRVEQPGLLAGFKDSVSLEDFRADRECFLDEKPLLLNPERDDPADHFGFTRQGEMLLRSERAETSGRLCKLNRRLLCLGRKELLDHLLFNFKKAASLVIETRERDKIHNQNDFRAALKYVFKRLFADLENYGEPNQAFSAFRVWIKDGFMEHVAATQTTGVTARS